MCWIVIQNPIESKKLDCLFGVVVWFDFQSRSDKAIHSPLHENRALLIYLTTESYRCSWKVGVEEWESGLTQGCWRGTGICICNTRLAYLQALNCHWKSSAWRNKCCHSLHFLEQFHCNLIFFKWKWFNARI